MNKNKPKDLPLIFPSPDEVFLPLTKTEKDNNIAIGIVEKTNRRGTSTFTVSIRTTTKVTLNQIYKYLKENKGLFSKAELISRLPEGQVKRGRKAVIPQHYVYALYKAGLKPKEIENYLITHHPELDVESGEINSFSIAQVIARQRKKLAPKP
jgi:hypothetical protein